MGVWLSLSVLGLLCLGASEAQLAGRLRGPARLAVLTGALAWGVLLVLGTEALSSLGWLTGTGVALFWTAGLAGAGGLCLLLLPEAAGKARWFRRPLGRAVAAMVAGAVLLALPVLGVALLSPPTTWDSQTYHMARVMHWAQNGSVAHYPTHILRQLHHAPAAEYAILHLQLLAGSDRYASLPQWLAMAGCAVGVSLIAGQLGARWRGQALAALLAVSLPMGLLQASTTQNDYVAAFWLVCLTVFALRAIAGELDTQTLLPAGAALALGVLTKGTVLVLAPPIVVWAALRLMVRKPAQTASAAMAMGLAVLALNAGPLLRNTTTFGAPMVRVAEQPGSAYGNELHSPPALLSNVVRNVSIHLATDVAGANDRLTAAIERLHASIGLDPSDPRTTWATERFRVRKPRANESLQGNPLHLGLIGAAAGLALLGRRRSRLRLEYLAMLAAGFGLFCLALKWQPYHSRLHLPWFVLACPLAAAVLEATSRRGRRVVLTAALVFLLAWPYALANEFRPWFGVRSFLARPRAEQYFVMRPVLREPYLDLAHRLEVLGVQRVGLITGHNDWEYPLWVLLGAPASGIQLRHVNVTNDSAVLALPGMTGHGEAFVPEAVVSLRPDTSGETLEVNGRLFRRQYRTGPLTLYLPVPGPQAAAATAMLSPP